MPAKKILMLVVVAKPFLERGYTLFAVGHGVQPKFTVSEIVPDIHRRCDSFGS